MENSGRNSESTAFLTVGVVLAWLAFSCADVYATTMAPGPPDDVPELISTGGWIEKYNTDPEYRKRHDDFSMAIRAEIDPARIIVSRYTIAKFNLDSLLPDRSQNSPNSVLEEFRITPYDDLSIKINVSKNDQLSELMTGNLVMTGIGKNYWDPYNNKDIDWQITMAIRQSRTLENADIAVTIQMESVEGTVVVKPIETVLSSIPDEFLGHYLVINYQLGTKDDAN